MFEFRVTRMLIICIFSVVVTTILSASTTENRGAAPQSLTKKTLKEILEHWFAQDDVHTIQIKALEDQVQTIMDILDDQAVLTSRMMTIVMKNQCNRQCDSRDTDDSSEESDTDNSSEGSDSDSSTNRSDSDSSPSRDSTDSSSDSDN